MKPFLTAMGKALLFMSSIAFGSALVIGLCYLGVMHPLIIMVGVVIAMFAGLTWVFWKDAQ